MTSQPSLSAAPGLLYHATTQEIQGALEPHIDLHGTTPMVFAQPDRQVAFAYALKDQNMRTAGRMCGYPLAVFNNRDEVLKKFQEQQAQRKPAGYIHVLPPDSFKNLTAPDGSPGSEWVSEEAVQPEEMIAVSGPDEVMREGVQLFFLSPEISRQKFRETWQAFRSPEEGIRWLRALEKSGLLFHENQFRDIAPLPLPEIKNTSREAVAKRDYNSR